MAAKQKKSLLAKLLNLRLIVVFLTCLALLVFLIRIGKGYSLDEVDYFLIILMLIAFPMVAIARAQAFSPEGDKSRVLFHLNTIKSVLIFVGVFITISILVFMVFLYAFGFFQN